MRKGVDVGGSFVKVLWEDGRTEKHDVRPVKNDRGAFLKTLREIILKGRPTGVGIAVAGFTSLDGTVYSSPNLRVLDGVNLKELLPELPLVVGNDVTLAAFGEWYYDHRDAKLLLFVAVGTGLGAGLTYEGRPFFGACGSALELGHHAVEKGGAPCRCGRRGCLEAYCSSYGLTRLYGEPVSDAEVIKRALSGEERALKAVEVFKDYLLTGLANAVHLFNPDRLVLGGGVIKGLKPLLNGLGDELKKRVESLPASCLKLAFTKAEEFAGARGALAWALERL
ncbi:MAG: ROK family protein [Aquificae bacterium]|nr:ROK family protein [Aquificota bacterium]